MFVMGDSSRVMFLLDMFKEFLDIDFLRIGCYVELKFLLADRLLERLALETAPLSFLSKFEGTPEAIKSLLSRLLLDYCLILRTTLDDLIGWKGNLEVPSLAPELAPL